MFLLAFFSLPFQVQSLYPVKELGREHLRPQYSWFRASQVAWWLRIHLPMQEIQVQSLVGKIPWRRKWQLTPEFLPGKSHGQRSLVGYSPWGHKELNTAKHTHTQSFQLIYYYLLNAINSLWHWYSILNSTINLPRLALCQVPCYQCLYYLPGRSEISAPKFGL